MAVQPIHHTRLDRTPLWLATPALGDGEGTDCAHPAGSHDQGMPELHRWPQPDRGDPPVAVEVPKAWRPEPAPRCDPDQVFGPRTPQVRLRAAQLSSAPTEAVGDLLQYASRVECYDSLTAPTSVAMAVARRAGRTDAVEAVDRETRVLVEWFVDRTVRDGSWTAALAAVFGPELARGARIADAVDHGSRVRFGRVVRSCLAVEAVADVIDPHWVCHAQGPWLTALCCGPGDVPGPAWRASTEVLAAIAALLTPLPAVDLMQVAHDHTVTAFGAQPDFGYQELVLRLRTWNLLGAADCPWAPTLEGLPGWADVLRPLGLNGTDRRPGAGATLGRLPELHDWARALAAALSHRARLSTEDVATFVRPVEHVLPGLEACLNGRC